jgi:amino acid transporter
VCVVCVVCLFVFCSTLQTEETQNAQRGGPISILGAILATSILGLAFLLAVTFSIQDYDRVINSSTIPIAQVFLDALGKTGAILVMCIIIVGVFFCANAGATSNARLIYALSRDGALPFSGTLHKLDPKTQSPVIAVWALLFVGAILGLPYLGSATAFVAITSVCTISLYITYGLPTLCLLFTRDSFVPGPFNLGRFSQLNGIIAVSWITFISVLFNMNYAIAIFGALWIVVAVYWVARGRYVFKGPIRNVESTTSSLHSVELEKPSPVLEADVSKEKSVATEVV